ncbi:MAG: hypothetical protein R6U10_04640 [Thermoplasmatota archaeon]
MRPLQLVALAVAGLLLATGTLAAYETAQQFNENRCWGCLALDPAGTIFDGFWTTYPPVYGGREGENVSHPGWITAALNETPVVMLFFWYQGCSSCKALWDKMRDEGTVTGGEADGDITMANVTLYSIDFLGGGNQTRSQAFNVYTIDRGAPTTVVLLKKDDTVVWYAFEGATYPKDKNGERMTVQMLLENAMEEARP